MTREMIEAKRQRVAELAREAFWDVVEREYPSKCAPIGFEPKGFEAACREAIETWMDSDEDSDGGRDRRRETRRQEARRRREAGLPPLPWLSPFRRQPAYIVNWDNGHDSGWLPETFRTKAEAQKAGRKWKRGLIDAERTAWDRKVMRDALSFTVAG